MIQEEYRKKFEEWARSTGVISWLERREDGEYESGLTQLQWEAFKAGVDSSLLTGVQTESR